MQNNLTGSIQYRAIIKGFVWSLLISVVLTILITLLLHFTPISENLLPSLATFIFFISILLGSTIAAKIAGSRGLIHGLGVGLSYLILSILLGIFIASDPFSWILFAKKIAYTLIGGTLGGIIGIGLAN